MTFNDDFELYSVLLGMGYSVAKIDRFTFPDIAKLFNCQVTLPLTEDTYVTFSDPESHRVSSQSEFGAHLIGGIGE